MINQTIYKIRIFDK